MSKPTEPPAGGDEQEVMARMSALVVDSSRRTTRELLARPWNSWKARRRPAAGDKNDKGADYKEHESKVGSRRLQRHDTLRALENPGLHWLVAATMGAYLSAPVTAKESSDDDGEACGCGASSMQGWRVMQEDAHNCIIDFDKDSSLFAVYDGHGGPEVAKYCAERLPQFIKETQAYKDGDLVKALEEAYLGFDATIADPEIVKHLKALASQAGGEAGSDDGSEEEDIHNLCEEARMPLQEVIAKYQNKMNTVVEHLKAESASSSKPLSPKLKPKKPSADDGGACSSSSGGSGSSKVNIEEPVSSTSLANNTSKNKRGEEPNESQVSTSNGVHAAAAGAQPDSPGISSTGDAAGEAAKSNVESSGDGVSSNEAEESHNSKEIKKNSKDEAPGASDSSKSAAAAGSSDSASESKPRASRGRASGLYNNLLNSDSDESDSNDETFEGEPWNPASSSDEETAANGVDQDSSEEGLDEEDSSEGEVEEDDEEMDNFALKIKNEPGSNSGCTAVVALLHRDKLYVANAGDSRCVVCRDGKAHDMSIDHKPEDTAEHERITKAGGRVSLDGRVNRGLNLSRAIGDLGYKQNHDLGPKEQMITAFPDVTTLSIDPETDSFMVLACDGIWNYMSSQNVVDFVSERLEKGTQKLSQICEEMFDHCLAPNAIGDGTGCDNMTALIVKFKPTLKKGASEGGVQKRPSDNDESPEKSDSKRPKTDNENSDVTSSV